MEQYLKEGIKRATVNAKSYDGWYPVAYALNGGVAASGVAVADSSSTGQQPPVFSTTNLQEAGVDETDLIKSDGKYLYAAVIGSYMPYPVLVGVSSGSGGVAVSSGGATKFAAGTPTDDSAFLTQYSNSIRVLKLSESPPSVTESSVIRPPDADYFINDFYLVTGRPNGQPDTLAMIASTAGTPIVYWFNPWRWGGSSAVYLVNVAAPASPAHAHKISFDGTIISTRRIGETLYVVSRFTPNIPDYTIYPATESDANNNAKLLDAATLADLLPSLTIDGVKKGPLVSADNCFLPPTPNDGVTTQTIITITAVNLQSPDQTTSSCIVGDTETVYSSTDSIYVATTRYDYSPSPKPLTDGATTTIAALYPTGEISTDIHKFSLKATPPAYCCSGVASGHLGWDQDKKAFRMGESNGYLRIATSIGDSWGSSSSTLLTVLGESAKDGGTTLSEVSRLPNKVRPDPLGKTGERLYAARFAGSRAFLVTFKVTDPLYILDISSPTDPFIAGELQTNGYSDYLQLINDNTLLGIGKDAVADASTDVGDGRGAWYQGLKLSVFDISNPAIPRESGNIVIGKRGTDSDALYDHRGITYVPPSAGVPARLAIHVTLHDTTPVYAGFDPTQSWSYYDWTHTGLYLFEINPLLTSGAISLKGKMITQTPSASTTYDWADGNSRSLILNDTVHFVKGGRVWSGAWTANPGATGPRKLTPAR
jgi:uncharacterized secreted protein with C-terminal beta-propeller domain